MKRFRLDLLLAVLFVLVMGFRMLPPTLHEVLGLIMLAGLCVHLAWNVRWFSSLGRGGWRRLPNYYDMRDCLGMYYMN